MDIQQSRTQTSANSERDIKTGHNTLLDKGKLIYRDPHCQSCRAKNTIYLKLHHDNIDRDSGIEILEPWQPHGQTTADSGGNNLFFTERQQCFRSKPNNVQRVRFELDQSLATKASLKLKTEEIETIS